MPIKEISLPDADPGDDPIIVRLKYRRKVVDHNGRTTKPKWVAEVADFTMLPDMPSRAMRYLALPDNNQAAMMFIESCIGDPDQAIAFYALCEDRGVLVRGEELGEALEWLTAEYDGRPTLRPSSSHDGP